MRPTISTYELCHYNHGTIIQRSTNQRPQSWKSWIEEKVHFVLFFVLGVYTSWLQDGRGVSHAVWRGAPLEMNGGTKAGFSTISLERLQCARRDSAGPTKRRRRWAWKSVSCECCVFLDRGFCQGLIPRPEESYRVGESPSFINNDDTGCYEKIRGI
jgi:hypothetical protein